MTFAGLTVAVAIGLLLLGWVVNLIRDDRLYVGYGVIFVLGTSLAIVILLVPAFLEAVTRVSTELLAVPSLSAPGPWPLVRIECGRSDGWRGRPARPLHPSLS